MTYGHDLLDRTVSITSGGTTTYLALDAAGRVRTRTTGSSLDTYSYLGTTDSVLRIANSGGSGLTTDSLVDPSGDRLGTRTGSTVAWLTPDLHGSVAAGLAVDEGSVSDALRYDGYGLTVAVWPTGGSPASRSWKYQGRLDLSPTTTSLYDFEARDYSPGLGSFTGLDSVTGSAQDPWQLNRYLYAAADPTTLVDPDGHCLPGLAAVPVFGPALFVASCSPEIVLVGALAVAGSTYAIQHPQEIGEAVVGLGRDVVGASQRAVEGAGDAITAPLLAYTAAEMASRGDAKPQPSYGKIIPPLQTVQAAPPDLQRPPDDIGNLPPFRACRGNLITCFAIVGTAITVIGNTVTGQPPHDAMEGDSLTEWKRDETIERVKRLLTPPSRTCMRLSRAPRRSQDVSRPRQSPHTLVLSGRSSEVWEAFLSGVGGASDSSVGGGRVGAPLIDRMEVA